MANIERISSIKLTEPIARIEVHDPRVSNADPIKTKDVLGNRKTIKVPGVGKVALELHPGDEKPHVVSTQKGEHTITEIVDRGDNVDRSEKFGADVEVGKKIVRVVFPVQEVMGPEMQRRRREYEKKRDAGVFPTLQEFYAEVKRRNEAVPVPVFGPKRAKPFYQSPTKK